MGPGAGLFLAVLAIAAQATPASVEPPAPRVDRATLSTEISASLLAAVLPRRDVTELRPVVTIALSVERGPSVAVGFEAAVEGLAADREGATGAARVEVREGWLEWRGGRGDLRVGQGRLVWGRLDEIAPTDVINPIDAARFLLEGRSAARMAVPFVRGRLTPSDTLTIEGVLVPVFRRGRFDRLDEATSPFNLVADALAANGVVATIPGRAQREPRFAARNISGGARVQVTAGRVDMAGSVYRGFDGIGPITTEIGSFGQMGGPALRLVEHHPRFTMIGADFETIAGAWAWRGEVASFTDRTFAARSGVGLVAGRSFDAGVGADRRAGAFRLFGSIVAHREWSSDDPLIDRGDVNLVGSIERTFGRERYLGRAFVVANPGDAAAFIRGVLAWRASDRLALEAAAGLFTGTSDDTIGRFRQRDFLTMKVTAWF